MADAGIKRVVISEQELPNTGYELQNHRLRFRIVSEDKTRFSAWSPFFNIANDGIDPGEGYLDLIDPEIVDETVPDTPEQTPAENVELARFIELVWTDPRKRGNRTYDIFVRWIGDYTVLGDSLELFPNELLARKYSGSSLKVKIETTLSGGTALYAQFIVQKAQTSTKREPRVSSNPIYNSGIISLSPSS